MIDRHGNDYLILFCTGTMLRENNVTELELWSCGLNSKGLCELSLSTTFAFLDLSWNRFDDQNITCLGKGLIT